MHIFFRYSGVSLTDKMPNRKKMKHSSTEKKARYNKHRRAEPCKVGMPVKIWSRSNSRHFNLGSSDPLTREIYDQICLDDEDFLERCRLADRID